MKRLPIFLSMLLMLAACNGMPKLFWDVDEGRNAPAYARGEGGSQTASRPPLTVPPELRSEIELPEGEAVGTQAQGPVAEKYRRAVAGKAVRRDARLYENREPAEVFSAVVEAMTQLNVPLDSVDSPSGIIVSDWIKRGKQSSVVLFGFSTSKLVRYKYLVRVFRASSPKGGKGTQLVIRTIGQVFETGKGWVTKPIKQKPVTELFDAVGEQLARMDRARSAQAAEPASEGSASEASKE
ncbi:MAG: outer membrane protein assembly factor BamC [Deltaproteobacteria bacterium]|nr:MAG: outer membrane protein assembly factor BamC [Deltaproteobacteria bacterium]